MGGDVHLRQRNKRGTPRWPEARSRENPKEEASFLGAIPTQQGKALLQSCNSQVILSQGTGDQSHCKTEETPEEAPQQLEGDLSMSNCSTSLGTGETSLPSPDQIPAAKGQSEARITEGKRPSPATAHIMGMEDKACEAGRRKGSPLRLGHGGEGPCLRGCLGGQQGTRTLNAR